jgi:hypothetical protein
MNWLQSGEMLNKRSGLNGKVVSAVLPVFCGHQLSEKTDKIQVKNVLWKREREIDREIYI